MLWSAEVGMLLVEELLKISKVGFKLWSQDTTLYMEQSLLVQREKSLDCQRKHTYSKYSKYTPWF